PVFFSTFFLSLLRPPPRPPPFPYTTLFRSRRLGHPPQRGREPLVRDRAGQQLQRDAALGHPVGWRFVEGDRDAAARAARHDSGRSEEHTSELQSLAYLVCRLLLEKKKKNKR